MFNRIITRVAALHYLLLIVAAVSVGLGSFPGKATAGIPPAVAAIQVRASGTAPFTTTLKTEITVMRDFNTPQTFGFELTMSGTRSSTAGGSHRTIEHWYIDVLDVTVEGKRTHIPLRGVETAEWERDDHGRILSYYFFADRLSEPLEAVTGEPFKIEPSIGDALALLLTPVIPGNGSQTSDQLFPPDREAAIDRIESEILPALRHGIAVHGSNRYMEKLLQIVESASSRFDWYSSVEFKDYQTRDGVRYARFSGTVSGSFTDSTSNANTTFENDGPIEILLDMATGAEGHRLFATNYVTQIRNNYPVRMNSNIVTDVKLAMAEPLADSSGAANQNTTSSGEDAIASVYKRTLGSVVDVLAADSEGTGFAVRGDLVLTTARAVGSSKQVRVILGNGQSSKAKVIAIDTKLDLALIKVSGAANLTPLTVESDPPAVGNQLLIIGSPADLQGALTTGIVSAIRKLEGVNVVQVDAPINTGNEGSPVINLAGQVIGILSTNLTTKSGLKGLGIAVSAREINRLIAKAGS